MRTFEPKSDSDDARSRHREIVGLLARAVVRWQQISATTDSSAETSSDAEEIGLIESENDRSL